MMSNPRIDTKQISHRMKNQVKGDYVRFLMAEMISYTGITRITFILT